MSESNDRKTAAYAVGVKGPIDENELPPPPSREPIQTLEEVSAAITEAVNKLIDISNWLVYSRLQFERALAYFMRKASEGQDTVGMAVTMAQALTLVAHAEEGVDHALELFLPDGMSVNELAEKTNHEYAAAPDKGKVWRD